MQILGVALVLEIKAKVKLKKHERNQKGWIERDGEKWKLKKLWVQKAEVDKSRNDELEYNENRNCWYLKVETQ